jgi:hypothetical protein
MAGDIPPNGRTIPAAETFPGCKDTENKFQTHATRIPWYRPYDRICSFNSRPLGKSPGKILAGIRPYAPYCQVVSRHRLRGYRNHFRNQHNYLYQ